MEGTCGGIELASDGRYIDYQVMSGHRHSLLMWHCYNLSKLDIMGEYKLLVNRIGQTYLLRLSSFNLAHFLPDILTSDVLV